MLEETKKEKVPFLFLYVLSLNQPPKAHVPVLVFHHQLLLNNQLEMEKMKVEQEKKKCFLAQETLKEKVKEKVLET